MKFQLFLSVIISLFSIVSSLPVYPGPQLHTFDTNRKTKNELFLERWQKNFGNRLPKPEGDPLDAGLFSGPVGAKPATVGTKPANPAAIPQPKSEYLPFPPSFFSPTSLIPLHPGSPVGPVIMHGALGPPRLNTMPDPIPVPSATVNPDPVPARGWQNWVPKSDKLPSLGLSVEKKPQLPSIFVSGPTTVMDTSSKPTFIMPPNTMTKADLINQIASQVSQDCPKCGENLNLSERGWKTRFVSWLKELWKKLYAAIHPQKKIKSHPDLPGIWWVDGEGFQR